MALSFLTILPLPLRGVTEEEVGASTVAFPVVGLIKGGVLFMTALLLGEALVPEVLSFLVLTLNVVITGALHLDGLSDTFDAIGFRGDRHGKLSVMKDPRVGPLGTTALVLTLLGKFAFLKAVLEGRGPQALLLFPLAGTTSMAFGICLFRPARKEGLGALFMRSASRGGLFSGALLAGITTVAVGLLSGQFLRTLLSMAGGLLVGHLVGMAIERHLGGHTGDTLGTLAELSELAFLFLYVVV